MLAEEARTLVMKRPIGKPKWATAKAPEAADVAVPGKKDLPAVQCITKAKYTR